MKDGRGWHHEPTRHGLASRGIKTTTHNYRKRSRGVITNPPSDRMPMSYKEQIKIIRREIKEHAPTLSVRGSRGTSYGWIDINGSGEFGRFTEEEKEGLREMGFSFGGNSTAIPPDDREYWISKLTGNTMVNITKEELFDGSTLTRTRIWYPNGIKINVSDGMLRGDKVAWSVYAPNGELYAHGGTTSIKGAEAIVESYVDKLIKRKKTIGH